MVLLEVLSAGPVVGLGWIGTVVELEYLRFGLVPRNTMKSSIGDCSTSSALIPSVASSTLLLILLPRIC
jgi:hypothetical protein